MSNKQISIKLFRLLSLVMIFFMTFGAPESFLSSIWTVQPALATPVSVVDDGGADECDSGHDYCAYGHHY
jgi:hypothetical protein